MKELMTYIAIDTDDVGESVGNAVLSNDIKSLSSISQNINSGIKVFSDWAEGNGGEIISSGSDEAIFKIPSSIIKDLEQIKDSYNEKTGFTISIGMGESVSDAAKALIYAKMNGKNQITDYSPEIERAMKESFFGNVANELEGGIGDETEPEDVDKEQLEMGVEVEKEHTDDPEKQEEIALDHLTEDDEYYSKLKEMEEDEESESEEEDKEQIEVPADEVDGDYGSEEMAEGQPEHEKQMSEEEEFIHDAQENREDEADDDIIEADEEENVQEEKALENMAESKDPSDEDIDLDGKPDLQEEHGSISPEDDLDNDGDIEHEEAVAAESGDQYSDEDDYEDEVKEDESEEEEEGLSDFLESEMESEEEPEMEPEMESEMESEQEQGLDHESIKSVIFESLQNFKQNKEYLTNISQENPELYQSLIFCLQAMIEMAKEFGYGELEEDMLDQKNEEDSMLSDEDKHFEGSLLENSEEDIEKNENFIRVLNKIHTISKNINKIKKSDEESFEELKEKVKKKLEDKFKKKVPGKKRKLSAKKGLSIKKDKKNKKDKSNNDSSFCARSHEKMKSSGKDCRSNEDKFSPLCSARKKFNCRGKNEEKNLKIQKAEKLKIFLKKKYEEEIEKSRLATKQTTKKIPRPHNPEGTVKGYKIKDIDNQTGKAVWIDGSRGLSIGEDGDPIGPGGPSPIKAPPSKDKKV